MAGGDRSGKLPVHDPHSPALYALLHRLLFLLDPETSHNMALYGMARLSASPRLLTRISHWVAADTPALPIRLMGLEFPNPVGLAAGFDKDARAFPALAEFGFGWIETGTVTPRPQPGNPRKRLFRLAEDHAIINRMGFNSNGLDPFIENLRRLRRYSNAIVGVNLGKNAATPMDRATEDYLIGLDAVYPLADYVAINISSPNTRSLRELQNVVYLNGFLESLNTRRMQLADRHGRRVPLAVKIAPDLDDAEIDGVAELLPRHDIDAVIATNTTVQRPAQLRSKHRVETGGLSGRPLRPLSDRVIKRLYTRLRGDVPIIGVGGIENARDACDKMAAGADLVQLYTSLIYQGPPVVQNVLTGLAQRLASMQISELAEAQRIWRGARD